MSTANLYRHLDFENDSFNDIYLLGSGIYLAFNSIYTGTVKKGDSAFYNFTANFCLKGRCDVALKSGKYAIVRENHISISTTEPDKDFYFPGRLYEGIQLYADLADPEAAEGRDFFSLMGVPLQTVKKTFCDKNGGLYISAADDETNAVIRSIWDLRDEPDIPLLRFLLVTLFHRIMSMPDTGEIEAFFTKSQIAIVKEAERIILSDLSKKHSAREMADYFGVSESSFKLYVKGILGDSYLSYFRKKRMEKAAQLLESTNMKVIDISDSVGYDNQGKFAKVFADTYGVSPLEYRRLSK